MKKEFIVNMAVSIGIVLIGAISVYYGTISDLKTRVSVLETKQYGVINQLGELIDEVKKTNNSLSMLVVYLSAKEGKPIDVGR